MKSKSPHTLSEMDFIAVAPFKNYLNAPYAAIDLFAGIGGTRLGFHMTGKVKTVFASEIDTFSRLTYEANFGDVPSGDITEIASSDIPDHDILVGGFPCQAFSQAGKKRGFEDVRGTLFFEVARIVRDKRPKAFLLENVKNLVRHNGGETFKTILSTLKDLNYAVYYKVLAAKDVFRQVFLSNDRHYF